MITIYENKETRDAKWKMAHLAEHPGCNFFMPECEFYTDSKLTAYAFRVLEDTESYDKLFGEDSLWYDSKVFTETRDSLIQIFEKEIEEELKSVYISHQSLLDQYRSDVISHVLERGREYDVYDYAYRVHAGKPTIDVENDPLANILIDRIQKAVFYLKSRNEDVSKYA